MDLSPDLDNYLGARRCLVDAMTRAFRDGTSASDIARQVAGAFSRDQVLEYLAAVRLHDSARTALADAGLAAAADITLTGIDVPRHARLHLAADPAVTPDYDSLPQQIRHALRPYHITMTALDIADPDDAQVDQLLRDDQPVQLTKLKPRT